MTRSEIQATEVVGALAGQSQYLPLRDGRLAVLWFDGRSLHLRPLSGSGTIGLAETAGEGQALETPAVVSE